MLGVTPSMPKYHSTDDVFSSMLWYFSFKGVASNIKHRTQVSFLQLARHYRCAGQVTNGQPVVSFQRL